MNEYLAHSSCLLPNVCLLHYIGPLLTWAWPAPWTTCCLLFNARLPLSSRRTKENQQLIVLCFWLWLRIDKYITVFWFVWILWATVEQKWNVIIPPCAYSRLRGNLWKEGSATTFLLMVDCRFKVYVFFFSPWQRFKKRNWCRQRDQKRKHLHR